MATTWDMVDRARAAGHAASALATAEELGMPRLVGRARDLLRQTGGGGAGRPHHHAR